MINRISIMMISSTNPKSNKTIMIFKKKMNIFRAIKIVTLKSLT